jgi:hypothetical protein
MPFTEADATYIAPGYEANRMALGAGGYVTGAVISADGTVLLVRTDSNGLYKYNFSTEKFVQCMKIPTWDSNDWQMWTPGSGAARFGDQNLGGCFEITLAADNLTGYAVVAELIYKTLDGGDSWALTAYAGVDGTVRTNAVYENANELYGLAYRLYGQKMACDPENPDVVYLSTDIGLYRTTDGWATYAALGTGVIPARTASVSSIPVPYNIRFDPSGGTQGSGSTLRTKNIYISVPGVGVHKSTDGGSTFTLIAGSGAPNAIMSSDIAADGTYWCCDTTGTYEVGIVKSLSGSTWTTHDTDQFLSICVDPLVSGRVLAMTIGGRLMQRVGGSWSGDVDVDATATDIPWLEWSDNATGYFSIGQLLKHPTISDEVWVTNGIGVFKADVPTTRGFGGDPLAGQGLAWDSRSNDIEQLVVNQIVQAPGHPPFVSFWDRGGVRMDDLDVSPSTMWDASNNQFAHGWGIDYCAGTPAFQIGLFVFNTNRYAWTDDGWDTINTWPDPVTPVTATGTWGSGYTYGDCAVDAVDINTWYMAPTANRPYVTRNKGVSWTAVALPSGMDDDSSIETGWGGVQRQATYYLRSGFFSDKTTAGTVWIDHYALGLYKSTDYGASWTLITSDAYNASNSLNCRTKNWPGKAGHLWRTGSWLGSGATNNLEVSVNGGVTWNNVPNVTCAGDFSMGKAAAGNAYGYDAYLFGRITGGVADGWGLWRSSNLGSMAEAGTLASTTWTQITGPYPLNNLNVFETVEADKDTEGLVYIGNGGGQGALYVRRIETTRTIRLRGI